MKIYIYTAQTAHGIIVIVENLVKAFQKNGVDCIHIKSLEGRAKDDIIISYGVKEANEVLEKGYRPFATFMADAITLGYLNKIKFYLRHCHFLNYDFFYSVYGYLRYTSYEKKVAYNFEKAFFVSDFDINYIKKKYPDSKCQNISVANGAPLVEDVKEHIPSEQFRIGLLSQWGLKTLYEESNWFIRSYWKRFHKTHQHVLLRIAGRGSFIHKFEGLPGIEIIGEVDNLGDFFANCDVSLLLCPKGCGILNRVLDSFMYKIPVVGYEASFTGFPDSDNICYKFSDYKSFENIIETIIDNREDSVNMAERALRYVHKNHNWEKNYDNLVSQILTDINK